MSSSANIIDVGARAYVKGFDDYGLVARTSFLGLKDAPVIQLDDGTYVGMAGGPVRTDIVPVATGKSLDDQPATLPLDVKTVGTETLTAMGIDPAQQTAMFQAFTKLPKATRVEYSDRWLTVSQGTEEEKAAFVQDMIATLIGG